MQATEIALRVGKSLIGQLLEQTQCLVGLAIGELGMGSLPEPFRFERSVRHGSATSANGYNASQPGRGAKRPP